MSSDQPAPVEEAKESEAPTAEEVQPAQSPLPEVQAEETLLRQANHWHALYLDAQASVARFRADAANLQQQLADSLEREKHLSSRNLQLHCRQPCEEQEELVPAGVSQLRSLEKLLVAKDAELRRLQEELADRRTEVTKLRADRGAALSERAELETLRTELRAREGLEELLQAKELELANVRKVLSLSESSTAERLARAMRLKLQELHQSLSREDAKSQLVEAKDQQLHRLHRELAEQKELCRQVTEDAEEMRAICADRLVSCGNQEASHIRLIESLRAENAMADMRIQSLEMLRLTLRI
ncbi:unnamed protein product [Symbiodinium natans]|uniref:Uncharacterized protein n=1 Tax=Symbiodinium natans TaxID=878477 RepID=A0A812S2D1_9DINO|nr:unnamed protein product [Symbiodinium natans]